MSRNPSQVIPYLPLEKRPCVKTEPRTYGESMDPLLFQKVVVGAGAGCSACKSILMFTTFADIKGKIAKVVVPEIILKQMEAAGTKFVSTVRKGILEGFRRIDKSIRSLEVGVEGQR